MTNKVDVILGAQWGDEGKGKLVDILSASYDVCCRVAGGSNAGHTIVVNDKKYKFHLIPSSILHENVVCVIGNGVVLHVKSFLEELTELKKQNININNRILISDRAHLVFDFHQQVDGYNENNLGKSKIGTTLKGIGPTYSSKINRNGLRVGDLKDMTYFRERLESLASFIKRAYPGIEINIDHEIEYYNKVREQILPFVVDTIVYCNNAIKNNKKLIIEGANATMLDLDFGTYPYVTSSNPSIGSCFTGLGIPPRYIGDITGIVKAYCTRVGEGPFPTELFGELDEKLRTAGGEFGTTTGRARRCGWVDAAQLRYSNLINGFTDVNLTKLDVLTGFDEVKIGAYYKLNGEVIDYMPASLSEFSNVEVVYETFPGWTEDISKCQSFDELPQNCKNYVKRLEELIEVKIKYIGVGPARDELIVID